MLNTTLMYTGPLFIAADHAGYQLKNRIVRYLTNELHCNIEDLGPTSYNAKDDYPDYAIPLAKKVVNTKGRGIIICGSGTGVCITTNKIAHIRCGLGYNIEAARSMMEHNNTNILALAGKTLSEDHAMAIVKEWLESEFSNEERHVRRLKKIDQLET